MFLTISFLLQKRSIGCEYYNPKKPKKDKNNNKVYCLCRKEEDEKYDNSIYFILS